ncbi:hypothetical protein Glove_37g48 [Diversispora epigaea]|uniref:GBD/FH3 domain-containing protein n=1 Tax=Diversispora epigaea TaxID=1348612 RepID=A0A397JH70_9GLOM|nr:hypothetical protein Glove_37g48 [Diversispora epigaea]
MAGIFRKKKSKQQPNLPEIKDSKPYNQIRPPLRSPSTHNNHNNNNNNNNSNNNFHSENVRQPQIYQQQSNYIQYSQPPGENQTYYQEAPPIQHSRSTSFDCNNNSSYPFSNEATPSTTSPSSSIARGFERMSGAFSPSEIQTWVSNYYRDNRASKNEIQKPPDETIEVMFLDLMNKLYSKNPPEAMLALATDKKWTLIKNDILQEEKIKPSTDAVTSSHDKNAPEWYLKKILEGSITVKHMNSLSVSLRTSSITWVRSFIDAKGLEVLANHLNSITRKPIKRETDLYMEYEIIKCLKSLLNNRWGAQEALSHPTCIYSITFSLVSPQLNTRKLVAEVLSFFCYCEIPTGHNLVLGGFDQLMQFQSEHGRFDAWMRMLENTIDGRGRYGSLVNASEEYKKGGVGVDNSLMEYALANMILLNSIVGVCDDVEVRVHLRNQLHTCGSTRIIDKMKPLNNELITRQINKYERESELDYEEVLDYYNHQILEDMTYPLLHLS